MVHPHMQLSDMPGEGEIQVALLVSLIPISIFLIFYYKDISDEFTVIFRVIQCVIVEEKTVVTFILNLWPCTVLH